jgi:SAM-dependent methyltransferase
MSRSAFVSRLNNLFRSKTAGLKENFLHWSEVSGYLNQQHTNAAFSEKWEKHHQSSEKEKLYAFQRDWYLKLYGFSSERDLANFLASRSVILDAGCGLGYKAAWFAKLAPEALVIGVDFSSAARAAAEEYKEIENLFFVQGDIADTKLLDGCIDYVSCDQVIMHTEDPVATFTELSRVTAVDGGEFACYFYAKKALPRELLDDFFRLRCKEMQSRELWELSEQLTELGKRLSDLKVQFDCPDVPALGIKGGRYDVQRFLYWNFIKCFWNEDLGRETSISTNFDWYSPSNARRFDKAEIQEIVASVGMQEVFFHAEEACFSGRFTRIRK